MTHGTTNGSWTQLGGAVTVNWTGSLELVRLYFEGPGEITYTSPQNKSGGTFIFTVDNVEGSGYIYAEKDNAETQDSTGSP